VTVLHPEQAPVGDHEIGRRVVGEKGCDSLNPLRELSMEHHPAFSRDVIAEQHLERTEANAEEQPPEEIGNGDTTRSVVARINIVVALGVVKLARSSLDEDVV